MSARRVSVLVYSPSSRTVSLLVSDRPDDERLQELARKWARIPLDDFPAARTVLLDRRPVTIDDAPRDVRLPPGAAADFGATSLHLEPLLTTEPVGILVIEPAAAAQSPDLESIMPLVAASVARIQARRGAEVQTEAGDGAALLELVAAATRERSLDGVLAAACISLVRQTGARRGWAFLLEEDRLVARFARLPDGSPDQLALERMDSRDAPELADAALRSGKATVATGPDSSLVSGWWAETFDVGAALAVPVRGDRDAIGVIVLDAPDAGHFKDEHARLASEGAALLSGIAEMARAIEERTSNLEAATAVRRLLEEGSRALSVEEAAEALARVTRDTLETEHASVFLADEEDRIKHVAIEAPDDLASIVRERLVGFPARDFRLWRRITRQRSAIFVEDATTSQLIPAELVAILRLRSYVAFPLFSADRPLGLVICSDTRDRRHWSADERQLVEQLALEGSLVIENAALRATQREQIDELSRQAFHDPLTELPNRTLFKDRLEHALARTRRGRQSVAVLLLDLDGFKEINDGFGHDAGDQVLIAVAQRLRGCLRPADTVARLGGDEFTILLEDIAGLREATRVAERIEASLRTAFMVEGNETHVTTSIGIALNEPGRSTPSNMLRSADTAMYQAKHRGKSRYEVFQGESPIGDLVEDDPDLTIRRPQIGGRGRVDGEDAGSNGDSEAGDNGEAGENGPLAERS